ncbi:Calmodulin-binding protein 60 a [Thalictrum thalictroides]|uniref:Calmodulin-binding protein 60 a n=1 Tax=Thalictrum thalictroides TaxID=46969 RepID=A0A7J6X400_THATH|nr:Calmodulin-binding protein 60 a [Thalictrum thalictroides]
MDTKSFMTIFLIFGLVLISPTLPSDAARFNHRELLQRPICPACVCCPGQISIPGRCCRCIPAPDCKFSMILAATILQVVQDAMKMHKLQKFLSGVEPVLRKVVKEEVEAALKKHFSKRQNCGNQIHPSSSRSLQLHFRKNLSLPIFTGSRIEGEEGSIIEVALVDAMTGEVVCSGPESPVKVEIVVLEGDFEGGDHDSWSLEEFNDNIVKERGGKRPLLTGDTILNLKEGTSMLGELFFTDNSSWTRSRKFRLGARVIGDNYDGVRVREAKTDAFMVKDHRGELYKKHYPPSLADEVWRLEKIGKDGAFHKRLTRENINTVKDFLTLFFVDALRLKNILGTGMSTKMWEVTVDHAQTCILDNRMYAYYPTTAQPKMGVVFNDVGKALYLHSEGQYISIDKLSETEKIDTQKLVKLGFEQRDEVIPVDSGSIRDGASHLPGVCFPSSSTAIGCSYGSQIPSSCNSDEVGFAQTSDSSDLVSSILSSGGIKSLDNITLQGYDNMDPSYDPFSSFRDLVADTLDCDAEAMVQSFCSGDQLPYFDSDSFQSQNFCLGSEAELQTAVDDFLPRSARSIATATLDKSHTRWNMLYSVLKWRFSIKRIMASKKSGGRETKRYS